MTFSQILTVIVLLLASMLIGGRIGVLMIRRSTINQWKALGYRHGYSRGAMAPFQDQQ